MSETLVNPLPVDLPLLPPLNVWVVDQMLTVGVLHQCTS